MPMNRKSSLGWLWAGVWVTAQASADVGTYAATVTALDGTYGLYNPRGAILNGTYHLSVRIEDDEVTAIYWTDGTPIEVTNGWLRGLQASVMSYQGQRFLVRVTDDSYQREDTSNDSVSDSQPDDG